MMSAPAKSKAVATVKLNDVDDMKESQPVSASQEGTNPVWPVHFENGARPVFL